MAGTLFSRKNHDDDDHSETPVRLIETRSGILLVPLTDAPMNSELAAELQEWQAMGQETWAQFSYEADEA